MEENYENCISDEECNAVYHRTIARTNRLNPSRFECPTCHQPRALSAWEHHQGYQCGSCTRKEEFGY